MSAVSIVLVDLAVSRVHIVGLAANQRRVRQHGRNPGIQQRFGLGASRGLLRRPGCGGGAGGRRKNAQRRCVSPMPVRGVRMTSNSGGGISPVAMASNVAPDRSGLPCTSW